MTDSPRDGAPGAWARLGHGAVLVGALVVVALAQASRVLPPRGLTARYWDNPQWSGEPRLETRERGAHLGGLEQLGEEEFPRRNYSVLWDGFVRIDEPGIYTFATLSDDGSALWVDDALVVDNGGPHAVRRAAGEIELAQGAHTLRVKYFQGGGEADLRVRWIPPGAAGDQAIPPDVLHPRRPSRLWLRLIRGRSAVTLAALLVLVVGLVARGAAERRRIGGATAWRNLPVARAGRRVVFFLVLLVLVVAVLEVGLRVVTALSRDDRSLDEKLAAAAEAELDQTRRAFGLRGMVQPSRFPGIVYELKPGLEGTFLGAPLSINAHGMRDRPRTLAKPAGTFRIAAVGDSSLFGWGVAAGDRGTDVLEGLLDEQAPAGTRFEVLNFAVPGYNTAIEVDVLLEKALDFEPDLLLVDFNTNDFDLPSFMREPEPVLSLGRLYLFEMLSERWRRYREASAPAGVQLQRALGRSARKLTWEQATTMHEDPAIPDHYRYMVGTEGYRRAMRKLAAETDGDIPVLQTVLLPIPGIEDDPLYAASELKAGQLALSEEVTAELGFELLNTYRRYVEEARVHMKDDPKYFWVTPADSHPSPAAHRILAEEILRFLRARHLVPTAS